MFLQSLRRVLRNRFQRWAIKYIVPMLFIVGLWLCFLLLYDRLERIYRKVVGLSNLHLEHIPVFLDPNVALEVKEVEGQRGLLTRRHLFVDERTTIEHTAWRRRDNSLVETVRIERRYYRGLYLTLVDGELTGFKRLQANINLPTELNEWQREALKIFMELLHKKSPLPTGHRRYSLTSLPSFV